MKKRPILTFLLSFILFLGVASGVVLADQVFIVYNIETDEVEEVLIYPEVALASKHAPRDAHYILTQSYPLTNEHLTSAFDVNLVPDATDTRNFGSSSKRWASFYVAGQAQFSGATTGSGRVNIVEHLNRDNLIVIHTGASATGALIYGYHENPAQPVLWFEDTTAGWDLFKIQEDSGITTNLSFFITTDNASDIGTATNSWRNIYNYHLRLQPTSPPATPTNGDIHYNLTDNKLYGYINGAWVDLGQGGGTGNVSGSGLAGQVSYWVNGSTVTGNNNLFWNNTDTRLGIGTNTPVTRLDVSGGAFASTTITTFTDTDATPSVSGGNVFKPALTFMPFDITDFDDGVDGQVIIIIGVDGQTTIKDGAGNINCANDFAPNDEQTMTLVYDGATWLETARSLN